MDIELYNRDFFEREPKDLKNWDAWVDIADEMQVHTRGETPGTLLDTRRPNEDVKVWEYRKDIYEPVTKGPINRSISKLFRIFQNSNFSYKVSENLEEYLKEPKFSKRPFFEYFYSIATRLMIEDPNGYLAWLPDGKGLTDPTEKVDVIPEFVDSEKIWYVDEEILTWRDDPEEKNPDYFYSLTKEGYYLHIKQKDSYALEEIYIHNLKILPALVMGGEESEKGFESFFNPFLPFGNECIRQYSDWQAVVVTSAFPYRTEEFTECDFPECQGRGWYKTDEDKTKLCPVCKGTGHKPHTSPYGTFVRKEAGPGEEPRTGPMVEFTSPAVDIIKYSEDAWMSLLEQARKAIFDEAIEEAQSGVAKLVDREDFYSFLSKIADNVYDHLMKGSLTIINGYRDISSSEEIEIIKPSSFVIKTESDLVNELGTLLEKKAPLPFVLETVRDLTNKRFANNQRTKGMINFLMVYDPLFALSAEEKNMLLATNVVDDMERSRNINSYQALIRLAAKDENLFEKNYEKIEELMDKEIEKINEQRNPQTNTGETETL